MTTTPKTEPFHFQSLQEHFNYSARAEAEKKLAKQKKEPTFSKAQLAAEREAGYKQGHQEGLQTGIEQGKGTLFTLEQQVNQTLATTLQKTADFFTNYQNEMRQCDSIVSNLALVIAKKIAGEALSSAHEAAILSTVRLCLQQFFNEPHIRISVHPDLQDSINKKIASMPERGLFHGDITISSSNHIAPGDCVLEWKNGEAILDQNDIWKNITALLSATGADSDLLQKIETEITSSTHSDKKSEASEANITATSEIETKLGAEIPIEIENNTTNNTTKESNDKNDNIQSDNNGVEPL